MLTMTNVHHHINGTAILSDINLQLASEQVIALIGPNGAGKSTLFSVMTRLQPLQQGSIQFGEYDIQHTDATTLAKTVAMLAQENHIQGRLRVHELLMFGRYPYHQGRPTPKDKQMVQDVMMRFELETLANRFLASLSGGQRQRVLIAMVVCQNTPYLLLDEPLNNLDMYHAGKLMRKLRALVTTQKKTVVMVLHDINQAAQFADTVIMMKNGNIKKVGKPACILTQDNIFSLYGIHVDILQHKGKPVIVDICE